MKVVDSLKALLSKYDIKGVKLSEIAAVQMVAQGKLADGTMIASPAESFEVGAELYIVDAEGNTTPAPDGEHTLEDGTMVSVIDGKIAEMKPAESQEEEMSAEIAEAVDALGAKLDSVSAELSAVTTERDALKTELSALKKELEQSKAKVTELSKKPAAESVKKSPLPAEETKKQDFSNLKGRDKVLAMIAANKN